jgi:hypothetical protein
MANKNPKRENLKPFTKGFDPRRNLNGVPADAIAARKFWREIGAELVALPQGKDAKGNPLPAEEVTRYYLMGRGMMNEAAKNPKAAELVAKIITPGLLKDEIELKTPEGGIFLRVVYEKEGKKTEEAKKNAAGPKPAKKKSGSGQGKR